MTSPFISIQLNSNRPKQIVEFFDSVESTADKPEEIEVLLHIDTGDTVMEELTAREKERRKFSLRILQTDLVKSYATLWKPLNPLFKMTHPNAYFVANLFDELEFETKGWDTLLRQYIGYYPDNIFRLRGSRYRFRNYQDVWECGFAPDSMAFYTRKWLELNGDWNPCLGPDSFQQCVAYYLFTSDSFSHTQYNRDIALPEIKFIGEGAGIGLEGEARFKRMCINNRAWFILMSHEMQQEAKRRAMRLKSHIIAYEKNAHVEEDTHQKRFTLRSNATEAEILQVPYNISWWGTTFKGWLRSPILLYYTGGGREALRIHKMAGLILMFSTYSRRGAKFMNYLEHLRLRYHHLRAELRHPYNHFKGVSRGKWDNFIHTIRFAFKVAQTPNQIETGKGLQRLRAALRVLLSRLEENKDKKSTLLPSTLRAKRILFLLPPLPLLRVALFIRYIISRILPESIRNILRPFDRKSRKVIWKWARKFDKPEATPIRMTVFPGINLPFKIKEYVEYILYQSFYVIVKPILLACLWVVNQMSRARQFVKKSLIALLFPFRDTLHKMKLFLNPEEEKRILSFNTKESAALPLGKIICSVQLSSNRPGKVRELLDNIEQTANNPAFIEVLVHMDEGDTVMENLLIQEQKTRVLRLSYLKTDLVKGFTHLWKAYNPLFALTHPMAAFVTLLSDEMRFETPGWDTELEKFNGYYPDSIFRLRGSKYRFRNYTDFWECGFAPDSIAFYTRKWLAIQGDWNPCTGPDSFQQMVSFYLFMDDPFCHTQYNRDITLNLMKFSGEGASVGLEGAAKRKRIRENNRAWFVLMSPAMQRAAKRRAMLLKANIIAFQYMQEHPEEEIMLCEYEKKSSITVETTLGKPIETLFFTVPSLRITLTNWLRAPLVQYYAGGGKEAFKNHPLNGIRMMIDTYFPVLADLFIKVDSINTAYNPLRNHHRHKINHVKGTLKHHGFFKGATVLFRQLAKQR